MKRREALPPRIAALCLLTVGLGVSTPSGLAAAQADPPPPTGSDPPRLHVLVVGGIGGAPEYADLFHAQALGFVEAVRERGLSAEQITCWPRTRAGGRT